ncbi:hypothetical protein BGX38DRAFT_1263380 [Terfezia claveryi]|nr:hypothetical protein BGX38DRAFT_1263380 [Terfezia claveryi]
MSGNHELSLPAHDTLSASFSDKAKFHQTLIGIETEKLYGPFEKGEAAGNDTADDDDDNNDDGEDGHRSLTAKELDSMRNTGKKGKRPSNADNTLENKMFLSVKLETQYAIYFRTKPPINPSDFVHAICSDFAADC